MNHKCMMVEAFWSTKSEMRNFQINKKDWRAMIKNVWMVKPFWSIMYKVGNA